MKSKKIGVSTNREVYAWKDGDRIIIEEGERYAPRKWDRTRVSLKIEELKAAVRILEQSEGVTE
jgi:hypothetical protein